MSVQEMIIGIGGMVVHHNPITLTCLGLGSCVGVALYDAENHIHGYDTMYTLFLVLRHHLPDWYDRLWGHLPDALYRHCGNVLFGCDTLHRCHYQNHRHTDSDSVVHQVLLV